MRQNDPKESGSGESVMTTDNIPTRRSFLKGGAILAAPLAAVAVPAAIMADGELKARLARLENEASIRELHQDWLRQVNSGGDGAAALLSAEIERSALGHAVRGIATDHAGEPDAIEVAADGARAAGHFHCAVEIETAIAQDCTIARMAYAQGGGFVRRTERRVLKVDYVKERGAWAIAKVEFTKA
jgi:hypothetical protein